MIFKITNTEKYDSLAENYYNIIKENNYKIIKNEVHYYTKGEVEFHNMTYYPSIKEGDISGYECEIEINTLEELINLRKICKAELIVDIGSIEIYDDYRE